MGKSEIQINKIILSDYPFEPSFAYLTKLVRLKILNRFLWNLEYVKYL